MCRSAVVRVRVDESMTATFFDSRVHPLYATFAIVEHAEYVSRCAIRSELGPEEDAVGSAVEVRHKSAATVGTVVRVEAVVREWTKKGKIVCDVTVTAGERLIAECVTEQRVMARDRVRGMYG
jgi:predicted thioesterase